MHPRQLWPAVKEAFNSWSDDYAPSMGAALSYYTLFSIAPLLVIVIAVAGLFFGADAVRGELISQLSGLMGEQSAKTIQDMLAHVSAPKEDGIAAAVSAVVLLLGATSVFGELQNDLDRIWHVPAKVKPSGLWGLIRTRLLSFGMIVGLAFILMVSLVFSAALSALGKWWGAYFGAWILLAHLLDIAVSFGLITVVFALIYKTMPSVKVHWHEVWVGAGVTALLFTVGKFLIGLYLGKSDIASAFGAAGSLAILMVWVYYSAQIFLFGAEFTRVHARASGYKPADPQRHTATGGAAAEVPAWGKAAANEPAPEPTAARQAAVARRSAQNGSAGEVVIRDGRILVDPLGRGAISRQASRTARAIAARQAASRNRSLPAMSLAAAAGVLVGLVFHVKSMRRPSRAWFAHFTHE